jgi:hypothetical protein
MKLKNLVAVFTIFASGGAIADSYKADVGFKASRVDYDGFSSSPNTFGLTGAFYFDAVETANVPLGEAAYLGKNSNVYADVFHSTDAKPIFLATDFYKAGVEFFIPENFLYISGGVTRFKNKYASGGDWYTSVGLTPIDGLLITTNYIHDQGYDPNINAKYVTALGNDQFINLEASFEDTDYGNYTKVGGDFYFDRSFSVGGSVEHASATFKLDGAEYTYELRTRKFFSEKFSGNVSLVSNENVRGVTLGVNLRF